jgi:5-(hydroxymethyl)furfural/furfural oxidase
LTALSEAVDILIAGGGSAGCALAARLSEDPATRVLLVEAGGDLTPETFPPQLSALYPGRAYFDRRWLWPDLQATRGDSGTNRPGVARHYEQARILGGGSSINGICANRGSPYDYDEWESLGAAGWGWSAVLPYFRKLESDQDFAGPLHGNLGPIPIRRHRRQDWTRFTRGVAASFAEMGYPMLDDQNGDWADGVIPTTYNADDRGNRASAAVAYLTPQVRRRPNLQIMLQTTVERLIIEAGHARAMRVTRGGQTLTLPARQIIVCMGALQSPILLMRNGIGPASHLRERGIDVIADRPGVGENLSEHPNIGLSAFMVPDARLPPGDGHHLQALLRFSSGLPGTPPGDMHCAISSRTAWHAVGRRIGGLGFWVNKAYSTGRVRLPARPDAPADIDFRMLSDPRDMARLKAAFRLGVHALRSPSLAGVVLDVFPAGFSARIRALTQPSRRNAVAMTVVAPLMDVNARLRRGLMAFAMDAEMSAEALAEDDAALEAHLRRMVEGTWHACGTCRMGSPTDPMAVVDPSARVLGVTGLRVVDASIMPSVPCANLNIPVLMMAEKIADAIKAQAVNPY